MCDLLSALGPATADGVTRFAKNSDRPPDEPQVVEWHPPRREASTRATYIEIPAVVETLGFLGSRPVWMWGVEHGVNEAGVAAGNATIYTTLDPRGFPDALTGMDLVRLALERASTASAAVEVVTDLHPGARSGRLRPRRRPSGPTGPRSWWPTRSPRSSSRRPGAPWPIEEVVRTRAISNRTTIPAFDAEHRHPRQPVETLVDPRWRASQAVLAAEPVTTEALEAHLASHVGGDRRVDRVHARRGGGGDHRRDGRRAPRRQPAPRPLRHRLARAPTRSCVGIGRQSDQDLTQNRGMRIAFGTDERTALTDGMRARLAEAGHEVVECGDGDPWPDVGRAVGEAVAGGRADRGVVCCWTGTGVSMAANKVAGVRAALCTDAETARGRAPVERRQRARTRSPAHLGHRRRRGRRRLPHHGRRSVGARADRPALLDSWGCRST